MYHVVCTDTRDRAVAKRVRDVYALGAIHRRAENMKSLRLMLKFIPVNIVQVYSQKLQRPVF